MSKPEGRVVLAKLSGELLAQGNPGAQGWNVDAVNNVGHSIAEAYAVREELGICGLTFIPGGGNIARGAVTREIFGGTADGNGRLATIQNTLAIAATLTRLKIPHVIMLAQNMGLRDKSYSLEEYSAASAHKAHQVGKIVLIAGGTGEDNKTTDSAVVFYAKDYKTIFSGPVTIYKGTANVDGVCDKDPRKVGEGEEPAKLYMRVGADYMLGDYVRFKIVDRQSLEQLADSDLSILVYRDGGALNLAEVMRRDPRFNKTSEPIGTVIVPRLAEPVFYE
ncbi:MAG: kinase [Candidatus Saccharibacteria bacterium]|nr:kinase [Candidatus Saccharibacteria bacterium]